MWHPIWDLVGWCDRNELKHMSWGTSTSTLMSNQLYIVDLYNNNCSKPSSSSHFPYMTTAKKTQVFGDCPFQACICARFDHWRVAGRSATESTCLATSWSSIAGNTHEVLPLCSRFDTENAEFWTCLHVQFGKIMLLVSCLHDMDM